MSEKYEWPVLPLSAEILHLDDDMLKAVLVEIRANVRAAVQAAQPEAVGEPSDADWADFGAWAERDKGAMDMLVKLIDVWDDGQLPHEHRCYVDGAWSELIAEARSLLAAAPTEAKPATQPICEGCGKTIPEHDALLRCKAEATQQASGERTPQDFALEHAEYMAQSAEDLIAAVNDLALAEEQHDDGTANPSDVDAARETLTEMVRDTRSCIYEFRKRRDRAALSTPAQQDAVDADMVLRAARELCRIHAGECQVNEQDTWNLYAEQFKRDADAVLRAAAPTKEQP